MLLRETQNQLVSNSEKQLWSSYKTGTHNTSYGYSSVSTKQPLLHVSDPNLQGLLYFPVIQEDLPVNDLNTDFKPKPEESRSWVLFETASDP